MRLPSRSHATLVARTELRRRWRATTGDARKLLPVLLGGGILGLSVLLATGLAYVFADQAAGADLVGVGGQMVAFLTAIAAATTAMRAGQKRSELDHSDAVLTAIPHRDALAGLLLAEFAFGPGLFFVPVLLVTVAFVAGGGPPSVLVSAPVAGVTALVVGTLVGFVLGIAIRTLVARSPWLARYKTVLSLVLVIGYFGALLSSTAESVFAPVADALAATPLAWYGDLAFVATPAANPLRAAGALVGSVIVAVGGAAAATRLAGTLWFRRAATPRSDGTDAESGGGSRLRIPLPGGSSPTGRVARRCWLRARRAPITLVYVLYPVFFLYLPVGEAVESGRIPASLPPLVALYGAWATGAAFTLNPLGEEGAVLPVTLTTGIGGRRFVAGCCLAGAAVGAPLTAAVAAVTGAFGPFGPVRTAAVALLGALLPACATALASGVGASFPRFEATSVGRSRSVVIPSLGAFAFYSVALLLVCAPGVAAAIPVVAELLGGAFGVSATLATLGGVVATAALAGAVGAASFAVATRRFDAYELA